MHRLRSSILDGRSPDLAPAPEPDRRRRSVGAYSAERRIAEQRAADRFGDESGRAFLLVRGKRILARVINASAGGLTVEAPLIPVPGDTLRIEGGADSEEVVVRWVEGGRIGLKRLAG